MAQQPVPYLPAVWDNAEAYALQACYAGTATPEQQQRALAWIILKAAQTDDVEFRTDSREHAFCSGRRFVGLQIRKMIGLNLSVLTKNREN